MTATWMQGDVHEQLAKIPDGSVDLIVTSPPFLALRSYLPADHPDKHREIGSEATPADFLDTLLALTAEWGRVLAPHGSICVELGDTYSGSHAEGPINGVATSAGRANTGRTQDATLTQSNRGTGGTGWPLDKSLTGIPTLYTWSLAYGRNLLTGAPSPAGQWRIRNVIVWARPNPPVGALGDKFRPATSYITVACRGPRRYFDLDAVRGPGSPNTHARLGVDARPTNGKKADNPNNNYGSMDEIETAGAPPLDWHTDGHPEDGDWLWKLSTAPYKGAHYATYPLALPTRLIEAMCPQRVCVTCGKASERIVGEAEYHSTTGGRVVNHFSGEQRAEGARAWKVEGGNPGHVVKSAPTLGFTDCGHDAWRRGMVLDPFAGSGTTGAAAVGVGRDATLIDIDARNLELAPGENRHVPRRGDSMNASQLQSGDIFRFLGGRVKFLAKAQRESSHGSTWVDAIELDSSGAHRLMRCIASDRPVTVVSRAQVPAGVPVAAGDVAGVELPHAAPSATSESGGAG